MLFDGSVQTTVVAPTKKLLPAPIQPTQRKPRTNNILIENVARAVAKSNGIPEQLFVELVRQESRFNTLAKSSKGAIGLAQLMPDTAKALGVNPYNSLQNLQGGARYLAMQKNTFGSWKLALAAYNAGPGAVRKYRGIPPYRETQNYVRTIWAKAKMGPDLIPKNFIKTPELGFAITSPKKGKLIWN